MARRIDLLKAGPAVLLAAMNLLLPVACSGAAVNVQDRPVGILLAGGANVDSVRAASAEAGFAGLALTAAAAKKATEAGRDSYELNLAPGTLLHVALERQEKPNSKQEFFYVYRGTEAQPLVFDRDGFAGLLNGELVFVDLTSPEAIAWLAQQPPAVLAGIRTIAIGSGDAEEDLYVLSRFERSGVLVSIEKTFPAGRREELLRALVKVQPTGLLADVEVEGLDEVVPRLGRLTHLVIPTVPARGLERLRGLTFLATAYVRTDAASQPAASNQALLAALAAMPRLRAMSLRECQSARDFETVGKLKGLRHLSLQKARSLADLSPLATLSELRSVSLIECEGLKDISAIARLENLTAVVIAPMPEAVTDLRPLARLRKLKVLMADKPSLEKREAEYDEIRRELPECEILPLCMGAAEILLLLPLSIGAGLAWRGRSRVRTSP